MSSPASRIRGPYLIDKPGPDLVNQLTDLFSRSASVAPDPLDSTDFDGGNLRATAMRIASGAMDPAGSLIVSDAGEDLIGCISLEQEVDPLRRHRGIVRLLLVDPNFRGQGLAGELIEACCERARSLGLSQVYLREKGGFGAETYYARHDFRLVGRFPGGIRMAQGIDLDELWLLREL
ncbi:GNAT family N-acetyltransferase [Pseudonocardiaceae bacterium YIM PH 21723]|nr:GNAT family N-acetyltransferase [Pseudonocardiaceae bacterium YIM PH 21723]